MVNFRSLVELLVKVVRYNWGGEGKKSVIFNGRLLWMPPILSMMMTLEFTDPFGYGMTLAPNQPYLYSFIKEEPLYSFVAELLPQFWT